MRRNKLALFVHFVWATWDRLPLIDPALERRLYRILADQAQDQGGKVLALKGMPDHVHLVVKMQATVTIADFVKQIKGASSRFVNDVVRPEVVFKWQGNYGAFTVSRWDLERIIGYVEGQKEHHRVGELFPEWEECFEEDAADDPPNKIE